MLKVPELRRYIHLAYAFTPSSLPPNHPQSFRGRRSADKMAMSQDQISDFLAAQRDEAPEDLQPIILEFEDLWERKLWHQLTNALTTFFNHPESKPLRLQFYKVFVSKFADKINQLKLVNLALKAAMQCAGTPS
jgi:hypothetical protein